MGHYKVVRSGSKYPLIGIPPAVRLTAKETRPCRRPFEDAVSAWCTPSVVTESSAKVADKIDAKRKVKGDAPASVSDCVQMWGPGECRTFWRLAVVWANSWWLFASQIAQRLPSDSRLGTPGFGLASLLCSKRWIQRRDHKAIDSLSSLYDHPRVESSPFAALDLLESYGSCRWTALTR